MARELGQVHLAKLSGVRAKDAYFLGSRATLLRAHAGKNLPAGDPVRLALDGRSFPARQIAFEPETLFEIETPAAQAIIDTQGLTLGQNGIFNEAIEGA